MRTITIISMFNRSGKQLVLLPLIKYMFKNKLEYPMRYTDDNDNLLCFCPESTIFREMKLNFLEQFDKINLIICKRKSEIDEFLSEFIKEHIYHSKIDIDHLFYDKKLQNFNKNTDEILKQIQNNKINTILKSPINRKTITDFIDIKKKNKKALLNQLFALQIDLKLLNKSTNIISVCYEDLMSNFDSTLKNIFKELGNKKIDEEFNKDDFRKDIDSDLIKFLREFYGLNEVRREKKIRLSNPSMENNK